MGDLLILLGLASTLMAAWGLILGRVGWTRLVARRTAGGARAASFVAIGRSAPCLLRTLGT